MTAQTGRLGRADRLRKRREFQQVSRVGRRVAASHFVLLLAAGATGRTRLGVTVSRKVGNAVERNHVKRRVREWFRRSRGQIAPGSDLVVIARSGAARLDGRRISSILGQSARRLEGDPS